MGVEEGESFSDEGKLAPAELEEKFRNIARMESALAGFCLPMGFLFWRLAVNRSEALALKTLGMAKSELVKESLPRKTSDQFCCQLKDCVIHLYLDYLMYCSDFY